MKVYSFGRADAPALMLLPGTWCHWRSNFEQVLPLLEQHFRVHCVSYDGFDENEQTTFPTMLEETEKIEAWVKANCGGRLCAAYGCSLGGSFVGLLAARGNIHIDHAILGRWCGMENSRRNSCRKRWRKACRRTPNIWEPLCA